MRREEWQVDRQPTTNLSGCQRTTLALDVRTESYLLGRSAGRPGPRGSD